MSLLRVEGLSVAVPKGADRAFAAEDVGFDLAAGEILCIVGESGSGKSMSANAIMGLLPEGLDVASGRILFDGQDILTLPEPAMLALRGARIAMIFQEPLSALNPLMRVGAQIAEVFEAHGALTPPERRARALALEPSIIVADEAVSALDVQVQAQVLALLADLKARLDLSMIFITHDLRVAAAICDRILVMQRGRIVEAGPTAQVLRDPATEHARSLLDASPGRDYERAMAGADRP